MKFSDQTKRVIVSDNGCESFLAERLTPEELLLVLPADTPSLDSLKDAAKDQVRVLRRVVFYTLAGMQSEALANADTATAKAIASIQHALRGLPDIDLSACKTGADVNTAFAVAWMTIVASAPATVASAFNEVVS